MKTIIIIAVVFVAALAVGIGVNLYTNPDFSGFGRETFPDPVVTILTGEDGEPIPRAEREDAYNWEGHPVFVVGDSLTQGARRDIENAIDGVTIDALEGRNMTQGLAILREWDESGIMTDDAIIVVCLAHNITDGTVRDAQQIIDMIRPGQSLIMMTGHGRTNMEAINGFIRSLPRAYSYITVADWDLTVAQSPSLLSSDGVHIARRQGNELYADLILRALEVAQPMP
ncbi:MAG: hypothetical protein FWH32_03935 [Clostridiales bacterium]|nr:hypothetical protein [Clostridiales bacterium]